MFGALGEGGRLAGVRDKTKHSVRLMRREGKRGFVGIGWWVDGQGGGQVGR